MAASSSGTKVVKSSGETEVFDPNVITTDCVEAGVEFWTAAEVALEVSKEVYDGINSDEIQTKILKALYSRNREIAERYKRFHSMYVRTSSNTIERFDRKRIVNSLVKETTLPKEVAGIIARETEAELRRMNLDFTSGPLIREVVNVKLLEHGYEAARSDYTRLGMPVYDAAQFMESPQSEKLTSPEALHRDMANSIFREYALLKVLPLHLADAHMKGDIHIHGLEYLSTRPNTLAFDLRPILKNGLKFDKAWKGGAAAGPSKSSATAILHILKVLMALSSNFSSSLGIHNFKVWIAPYMEGLKTTQVKQIAQTCLFEISQSLQLTLANGANVDLEIEYGVPENLATIPAVLSGGEIRTDVFYSDFEDEAVAFARAIADVYSEGDYHKKTFGLPRLIIKLRRENNGKDGFEDFNSQVHEAASKNRSLNIINLSTSELSPGTIAHSSGLSYQINKEELETAREKPGMYSSLNFSSLNLPRAAYKAGGKDERLFEVIDDVLDLSREVAMVKRDVIRKRLESGSLSLLNLNIGDKNRFFDLVRSHNITGYVGLNEAVKFHIGEELHESSYARDFGASIINHIAQRIEGWNTDESSSWLFTSIQSQKVAKRFALLDSGQYSDSVFVKGETDQPNYTSSCFMPREAMLSPGERASIYRPFQKLSSGGLMEAIGVNGKNAEELWEISNEMVKARSGHWSFVP